MKILLLMTFVAFSNGLRMTANTEPLGPRNLSITVIEDHPWIIINETCVNEPSHPCQKYYGFLWDLVGKIQMELNFNFTITVAKDIGHLDGSKSPAEWTGLIGSLSKNETDVGLAIFNATLTKEVKDVITISAPFIPFPNSNSAKNETFAIGFPKGSKEEPGFSHLIKKLINQRHIEQLKEIWFNEERGKWSTEKQINKYP